MGKPRFDPPSASFPYKISKRLNRMSVPRPVFVDTSENLPSVTPRGIRRSALKGRATDRINDAALPYIRRFLILKRQCRNLFSNNRLRRIERMMEATNVTVYSKLANCNVDLRNTDEPKRKRGWNESDWKKHMDYINQISNPRREFKPPPVTRGSRKPLHELLIRINEISNPTEFKIYKRMSKDRWYKNPIKVASAAKRYVASERVKALATPKVKPSPD